MTHRGVADSDEERAAISDARIVLQPIVDLAAWSIIGFEALARFDDGVSPAKHLESAGCIGGRGDLELLLIARAMQATRDLPEPFVVTFNASGATILRRELSDLMRGIDRPWGIEIYEGETAADPDAVRERVSRLGGELLIDDAGSDCADVARITALRPDIVKIDRALFWRVADAAGADRDPAEEAAESQACATTIGQDPGAVDGRDAKGKAVECIRPRTMIDVLISAAREAGARVLIEGISCAAHLEVARSLGADLGQGFYLGAPTPVEAVEELCASLNASLGVSIAGS